ncbi:MAG: hypothetical protein WBW99_06860 [Pseudolabrys sp.]
MISAPIVFVVSGVVTFGNIGCAPASCRAGSRPSPPAGRPPAVLAFFAAPHVRRATDAIVRMIDGQA